MTATLTSVFFEHETAETLLKIMASNSEAEYQMVLEMIDMMSDLGDTAPAVSGVPDGEYALVIEADMAKSKDMTLYLCGEELEDKITLGKLNIDVIAQSALFYREAYTEAGDTFDASAQDDDAEEAYENELRRISAARATDFTALMAPYITDSPEFFHEVLQAFDLLSVDYAENVLATMPQEQLTAQDLGGAEPPRRVLN